MQRRLGLIAAAWLTAASGAMYPGTPLYARNGEPAKEPQQPVGASRLDEIVVTARRIEESLQDTPIALTAVTDAALEERGVEQITGVANIAPNVNFSYAGTSSGSDAAAVIFIRGVGQNDFTLVTDPGVGVYVDGVYLGRSIGSVLDVFDLKQIEILRGPQGTLFGRNTIGGAINLTTREIGDELGGSARIILGADQRLETFLTLDVPFNDSFALSFSAVRRERDGTVLRNDGTRLGDDNMRGGRIKARWQVNERWRSVLSVDGVDEDEESAAEVILDVIENSPFVAFFNNNTFGNGSVDPACARTAPPGGALANANCANDQFVLGPFRSAETGASGSDIRSWGASLTNEFALRDRLNIKSISAYREVDGVFFRPSDGTPFAIFQTDSVYAQQQFSQEIQLLGSNFDGRFTWVGGLFYFQEKGAASDIVRGIVGNFPRDIGASTDNNNWAVFGEATLEVSERLRLSAGLRYTDESKETDLHSVSLVTGANVLFGTADAVIEQSFNEVTWRAAAIVDISEHSNAYFTASTGFKSGGVVQRNTGRTPAAPTFEPEFVDLFELGLKSEFAKIGLRVNIAAFYSQYSAIQLDGVPPGSGFGTVQFNAGEADISGLEVEFDWKPTDSLAFSGALGLIDTEYTQLAEGSFVTLHDKLIRTPRVTGSLGASYKLFTEYGTFTPRIDWVYKSRHAFEPSNTALTTENGYHAFNAALGYAHPARPWRFTAGVANLTDEQYLLAADFNGTIGYELGIFARPRNWFISARYDF